MVRVSQTPNINQRYQSFTRNIKFHRCRLIKIPSKFHGLYLGLPQHGTALKLQLRFCSTGGTPPSTPATLQGPRTKIPRRPSLQTTPPRQHPRKHSFQRRSGSRARPSTPRRRTSGAGGADHADLAAPPSRRWARAPVGSRRLRAPLRLRIWQKLRRLVKRRRRRRRGVIWWERGGCDRWRRWLRALWGPHGFSQLAFSPGSPSNYYIDNIPCKK